MVAVKAADVDTVLRRLPGRAAIILVFGPDAGLVYERARALAEGAVGDPADPFQLVKLGGDEVAADPLKLADEANTIGLFGGKRAIWVKPSARNLAPALTPLLATPPVDALVVIEAGDLARTSPLRTLCERSPNAVALPCYADDARRLAAVLDTALREAGLAIEPEARELLLGLLGADRGVTRHEIEKLVLYAHGRGRISRDDVEAVVGDVSGVAIDAVLEAAFTGERAALDRAFARLRGEGVDAGGLLAAALRHALLLAEARPLLDRGAGAEAAVTSVRGLAFKRRSSVERQLRLWPSAGLARSAGDLGRAILAVRRQPAVADGVAQKALWALAAAARREGNR